MFILSNKLAYENLWAPEKVIFQTFPQVGFVPTPMENPVWPSTITDFLPLKVVIKGHLASKLINLGALELEKLEKLEKLETWCSIDNYHSPFPSPQNNTMDNCTELGNITLLVLDCIM